MRSSNTYAVRPGTCTDIAHLGPWQGAGGAQALRLSGSGSLTAI